MPVGRPRTNKAIFPQEVKIYIKRDKKSGMLFGTAQHDSFIFAESDFTELELVRKIKAEMKAGVLQWKNNTIHVKFTPIYLKRT